MAGGEASVKQALEGPDEVRQSRGVPLLQRRRWVCAVAKRAPDEAFLITAYPTDAIKEGVRVWPK
jgi:hypothetical protein